MDFSFPHKTEEELLAEGYEIISAQDYLRAKYENMPIKIKSNFFATGKKTTGSNKKASTMIKAS